VISDNTRKLWKEKLKAIEEANDYGCIELSEWEVSFLDSISIQVNERDLSMKQSLALNKIYERVS
jgi:hypothetical protein